MDRANQLSTSFGVASELCWRSTPPLRWPFLTEHPVPSVLPEHAKPLQLLELVAGDGMDTSQRAPSEAGDEAAGVPPHFFTASAAHRRRLREVRRRSLIGPCFDFCVDFCAGEFFVLSFFFPSRKMCAVLEAVPPASLAPVAFGLRVSILSLLHVWRVGQRASAPWLKFRGCSFFRRICPPPTSPAVFSRVGVRFATAARFILVQN